MTHTMHKSNEDCFYFLTSTCAKGSACAYRHSPLALAANVICPAWIHGSCHDLACPLRHNKTIQRPMLNNGISCFFETTPIGCLKPDCTFIHSRPRPHLKPSLPVRPASTNLINKDAIKSTVAAVPSPGPSTPARLTEANVAESKSNVSTAGNNETPATASITPLELSSTPDRLSPVGKKSAVPRRVAVLSESESSKERVDSTEISSTSGPKVTVRSVIPHSSERKSDDSSTTQSRLVVNRNVVLAEPVSSPSRKIVQSMTPTRVVLASTPAPSPSSKLKRNETKADKLTEQENKSKKFKSESRSSNSSSLQASESEYKVSIDISTPRAIANRRSLTVGDQASPNNETTTPSRLNRQPMTKRSSGNLSKSVSTPLIDQKTSSGTGLPPADARRTSRIERFKSKPSSSPPSTPAAPTSNGVIKDSSSTRNVITAPSLERKRTAPANIGKDLPPSKRISTSHSHSDEKKHERGSSAKAKQVDDSAASSTKTVPTQLAASPRFIPQPIRPPSPLSSTSTRPSRQRQPPSVVIKRPLAPAVAPSQTKTESTERLPTSATATNISVSKSTLLPVELSNLEDENQLLTLNEPSNFVDTFALIDEALLEADHLLELI